MGVDGELRGRVLRPDLVDVGLVVAFEEGGVEDDAVVGAQGAQVAARGVGHNERGPARAVGGALSRQARADGIEACGCHAGDVLRCVGGVGQGEGNGKADEIDVGNVDEELGGVEGEFAEVPG